MDNITYKKGLEIVSESEREYKKQRNLYEDKAQELTSIEKKIQNIKECINELKKKIISIDDIKRNSILEAEEIYLKELNDAEQVLKETNIDIDNSQGEDLGVKTAIKRDYHNRINDLYEKVDSAKNKVESNQKLVVETRKRCEELEEQISKSELEDNQIKLCAIHINSDYENVVNNTKFISDFKERSGIHSEDIQKKFNSLSSKKITRIALKMNSGIYASVDESKGLPIIEIFMMALVTLWTVIKGIFQGICILYRPIYRLYKVTHKLIYGTVVTLLVFYLLSRLGEGIVTIISILLFGLIVIFLGLVLFNIIQYGNKAFRKEQNLEYYTVGYYFKLRKDEIMYKIASEYYHYLKIKNPIKLENILQTTFGDLKSQKKNAEVELDKLQSILLDSQKDLNTVEEQFRVEKEQLEKQCDNQIKCKLKEANNLRIVRREEAKKLYHEAVEASVRKKESTINNAEKNAINTFERGKQEILDKENELQNFISRQNTIREEMIDIARKVDLALEQNNEMALGYKSKNIRVVQKRAENDKIPNSLVAGLISCDYINLVTGRSEKIYSQYVINHEKKPIIITCDIEDDESKVITESYYAFIDSLIGDLLGKTYIGAFRFVLVDSQGNKSGIIRCMETCRDSFDALERFGCVKIMNDRTDKCFDEIIKEQENLLNGKAIDVVNEAKKNFDNMVKYNFLCIRIYSKKLSDFSLGDFRKRIDNSLNNGIIPIVIMSQNYFENKQSELEGTIKELCNNCYYKIEVNSTINSTVKEVNFSKERIY